MWKDFQSSERCPICNPRASRERQATSGTRQCAGRGRRPGRSSRTRVPRAPRHQGGQRDPRRRRARPPTGPRDPHGGRGSRRPGRRTGRGEARSAAPGLTVSEGPEHGLRAAARSWTRPRAPPPQPFPSGSAPRPPLACDPSAPPDPRQLTAAARGPRRGAGSGRAAGECRGPRLGEAAGAAAASLVRAETSAEAAALQKTGWAGGRRLCSRAGGGAWPGGTASPAPLPPPTSPRARRPPTRARLPRRQSRPRWPALGVGGSGCSTAESVYGPVPLAVRSAGARPVGAGGRGRPSSAGRRILAFPGGPSLRGISEAASK